MLAQLTRWSPSAAFASVLSANQLCNKLAKDCNVDRHKNKKIMPAGGWYLVNSLRALQCYCLPFLPEDVALSSDEFIIHKDKAHLKEQWLAIIDKLLRDYERRCLVEDGEMATSVMPGSTQEDVKALANCLRAVHP